MHRVSVTNGRAIEAKNLIQDASDGSIIECKVSEEEPVDNTGILEAADLPIEERRLRNAGLEGVLRLVVDFKKALKGDGRSESGATFSEATESFGD
jgi:hypothetical protein